MSEKKQEVPAAQQLEVKIDGDRLVISIGVGLLAFACQQQDGWPEDLSVGDVHVFAKDIANELQIEEEDGTTPVHRMLDAAAMEMVESGAESVVDAAVEDGIKLAQVAMEGGAL